MLLKILVQVLYDSFIVLLGNQRGCFICEILDQGPGKNISFVNHNIFSSVAKKKKKKKETCLARHFCLDTPVTWRMDLWAILSWYVNFAPTLSQRKPHRNYKSGLFINNSVGFFFFFFGYPMLKVIKVQLNCIDIIHQPLPHFHRRKLIWITSQFCLSITVYDAFDNICYKSSKFI